MRLLPEERRSDRILIYISGFVIFDFLISLQDFPIQDLSFFLRR